MLALILAVAAVAPTADPMESDRDVNPVFLTLELMQPLEEGLPAPGGRLTGVFGGRFGLEVGVSRWGFFSDMKELSAVAVVRLAGDPLLLRAGVSHLPAWDIGDHAADAETGFHVGASLLSGDRDDRVRVRIDYTYRQLGDRGVSTLGIGLVMGWTPD